MYSAFLIRAVLAFLNASLRFLLSVYEAICAEACTEIVDFAGETDVLIVGGYLCRRHPLIASLILVCRKEMPAHMWSTHISEGGQASPAGDGCIVCDHLMIRYMLSALAWWLQQS